MRRPEYEEYTNGRTRLVGANRACHRSERVAGEAGSMVAATGSAPLIDTSNPMEPSVDGQSSQSGNSDSVGLLPPSSVVSRGNTPTASLSAEEESGIVP